MDIGLQIAEYLASLPEPKRLEVQALNDLALSLSPGCKTWFSDGKNDEGKIVANPTIGYGGYTIRYADGSSKEFFRIGLSANKTGISVYILGLEDKSLLATRYGSTIGKATITGYCIRFKTVNDINLQVLADAIRYGFESTTPTPS